MGTNVLKPGGGGVGEREKDCLSASEHARGKNNPVFFQTLLDVTV